MINHSMQFVSGVTLANLYKINQTVSLTREWLG